jgi:hypothetical protein
MWRSLLRLVAIGALVGAVVALLRMRTSDDTPVAAPEWPPLTPLAPEPTEIRTATPAERDDRGELATDGGSTTDLPIKAKTSSGIYHVPGGRFYDRTIADKRFATAAEAEADGYRPSKS